MPVAHVNKKDASAPQKAEDVPNGPENQQSGNATRCADERDRGMILAALRGHEQTGGVANRNHRKENQSDRRK